MPLLSRSNLDHLQATTHTVLSVTTEQGALPGPVAGEGSGKQVLGSWLHGSSGEGRGTGCRNYAGSELLPSRIRHSGYSVTEPQRRDVSSEIRIMETGAELLLLSNIGAFFMDLDSSEENAKGVILMPTMVIIS